MHVFQPVRGGNRLDAIARAEFLQNVGHVVLDRLFAQTEPPGDFLVGLTERDFSQDLLLSWCELAERQRSGRWLVLRLAEGGQETRGECRRDINLPFRHAANGIDEIGTADAFQYVGTRSSLERCCDVRILFRDRQHHDTGRWVHFLNLTCRLETAAGQIHIKDHDIRRTRPGYLQSVAGVLSDTYDFKIIHASQYRLDALPHERMIVYYRDTQTPVHFNSPMEFHYNTRSNEAEEWS